MKKYYYLLLSFLMTTAVFTSCVKDEDDNKEADIDEATIGAAESLLYGAPTIKNNTITFHLKSFNGSYEFAPVFKLSEGATIVPENGTLLDFSEPQKYTVTSKDGKWTKVYTVIFIVDDNANPYYYSSFENAKVIDTESPEGHYHQFYGLTAKGDTIYEWETANAGYNIMAETLLEVGEEFTPAVYPSAQIEDGYRGKGVKLQTKSTGFLGSMFQSPLAAGNLFLGEFKFSMPTIESTKFGVNYTLKTAPKSVEGYFKYKSGEKFEVNSGNSGLAEKGVDSWDAYAILFESRDKDNFLTGSHGFKDERIVSIAHIDASQRIETDEWTKFTMDFEFVEGKTFDPEKNYRYTIVFTSSLEGDRFNGAVGSVLCVDEVVLIAE